MKGTDSPGRVCLAMGARRPAGGIRSRHDMLVHGHTLVWHEQLPDWISAVAPTVRRDVRGTPPTLVGRYRGRVGSWDVVNEALTSGDACATRSSWPAGPRYIAKAFRSRTPPILTPGSTTTTRRRGARPEVGRRARPRKACSTTACRSTAWTPDAPGRREPPAGRRRRQRRAARRSAWTSGSPRWTSASPDPHARPRAVQQTVYEHPCRLSREDRPGRRVVLGVTDAHSWIDERFGEDDPPLRRRLIGSRRTSASGRAGRHLTAVTAGGVPARPSTVRRWPAPSRR
jgi:hypothetical protein